MTWRWSSRSPSDRRAAPGSRDRGGHADRGARRSRGARACIWGASVRWPRCCRRAGHPHGVWSLAVLFGVTTEVSAGECVCLLGRNGVASPRRCARIMGLVAASAGAGDVEGSDITGWAPYRVTRAEIGFVPEDRRIFAELTVWENLDVADPRRGSRLVERRARCSTCSRSSRSGPAQGGYLSAASSRCSPSRGR